MKNFTKKVAVLLIPLLALLFLDGAVMAQSAYGIQIPIRGASPEPEKPEEVQEPVMDEDLGMEVHKAASPSDAAKSANTKLQKLSSGAAAFETEDGRLGFMASGVHTYMTDADNIDAVRISQRKAYVIARFKAEATLTKKLYGASLESQERMAEECLEVTTNQASGLKGSETTEEKIDTLVSGLLRGAQIFECRDDLNGKVTVTVFCTPKSAAASRSVGREGAITTAAGFEEAVDRALDEILNGFVPPIGGRTITDPVTGTTAFIGYGSALVRTYSSPRAAAKSQMNAEKAARLRSERALVALIVGVDIERREGLSEETTEILSTWEEHGGGGPAIEGADAEKFEANVSKLVNSLKTTDEGKRAVKGFLPPNTTDGGVMDPETHWVTWYNIYFPGSEALVEGMTNPDGATAKATPSEAVCPTCNRPWPTTSEKVPLKRGPTGTVGKDPRKNKKKENER